MYLHKLKTKKPYYLNGLPYGAHMHVLLNKIIIYISSNIHRFAYALTDLTFPFIRTIVVTIDITITVFGYRNAFTIVAHPFVPTTV